MSPSRTKNLSRFALLSIGAAIITIVMKLTAYWVTNSVGLLSDALESVVNLVTAIVALIALNIAIRPASEDFSYGYSKVEFFSSGFEGGMILIAAGSIAATAVVRLLHPVALESVGLGLAVSVGASLVNLGVSLVMGRAARANNSITLEADARHLMTDVYTTAGVIVGVILVKITGWLWLDAVIAMAVAANILFTGFSLLRRSAFGLMDAAIPDDQVKEIKAVLARYEEEGVEFHALRTRSAAARNFMSVHVLVPGRWTVAKSHHLAEQIDREIREKLPNFTVFTHIEPVEDPASQEDINLIRD